MPNPQNNATRGSGLLESFLAKQRARRANQLIPSRLRQGRILDIGCGSVPYFLAHTSFTEKFAVDQLHPKNQYTDIQWHPLNINENPALPFQDDYFDVITLLAVIEHLDPTKLVELFRETYRVLKPGGMLILTTPASWSDGLLHTMARVGLVSREEIDEHVYAYTLPLLGWYFGSAGFAMQRTHFGYFEWLFNLWATAEK